jgi:hypothetical protein
MQDERLSPGDELTVARNVVRVHQTRMCPVCTDDGCPAEDWAVPLLFNAVVASWPAGPKTLAEVEEIARQVRGETG